MLSGLSSEESSSEVAVDEVDDRHREWGVMRWLSE
jgi:hypothetical protein